MANDVKRIDLMLPPGIGSYVTVIEPRRNDQNGKMEYSLSLIYPKSRSKELDPLRLAVQQMAVKMFGPEAMAMMNQGMIRNPIRDGDLARPKDPNYKGCLFVGARTTRKPGIVGPDGKTPIFSTEDVYSGCLMKATVSVFPYNKSGNKGVGVGLNNVQVLRKGERLDGRKAAEEEFEAYTEGEADPLA